MKNALLVTLLAGTVIGVTLAVPSAKAEGTAAGQLSPAEELALEEELALQDEASAEGESESSASEAAPIEAAQAETRAYLRGAKRGPSNPGAAERPEAGDVPKDGQPDESTAASKTESSLLRVVLAAALLAGLGGFAYYAKRRRIPLNLRGSQVQLSVVQRLPLGPKAQVALVSVGREALLLGVTEQGITTLRTYSAAEVPTLSFPPETDPKAPFAPRAVPPESPSEDAQPGAQPAAFQPSAAFQTLLEKASGAGRRRDPSAATPKLTERARVAEDVPEHLARALDAAGLGDGFDAPEGQAQELARRFRELHS